MSQNHQLESSTLQFLQFLPPTTPHPSPPKEPNPPASRQTSSSMSAPPTTKSLSLTPLPALTPSPPKPSVQTQPLPQPAQTPQIPTPTHGGNHPGDPHPQAPRRRGTGGRRGRGGRASVGIKAEKEASESTEPGSGGRTRGKNRGGRPRSRGFGRGRGGRGGKRKRGEEEEEEGGVETEGSEMALELPALSRSGRKIFKVNASAAGSGGVEVGDPRVPAATAAATITTTTTATAGKEKKTRGGKRKPGEGSICCNCGRGHSPAGNVIVFCDGCDRGWHQYCHDGVIEGEVLLVEAREWFCGECCFMREERGRVEGRVGGEGMSVVEKRKHLQSLPSQHLISLLLHASTLYPTLPIFLPPNPSTPPPHHSSQLPSLSAPHPAEEDDPFYSPLPYPKPGNGVRLPPESADLALLVDDDVGVFSHFWGDGVGVVRVGA